MKTPLKLSLLLLFSCTLSVPMYAQKQSSFTYSGLTAKLFQTIGWTAKDFGIAAANPNVFSSVGGRVNGLMYVRVTLVADDPSFLYQPTCDNNDNGIPDGQEGLECRGTYRYPKHLLNGYTQTEQFVGWGENIIGAALPGPALNQSFIWTGTLTIESLERPVPWDPTLTINIQTFYVFDPVTFSSNQASGSTACNAYHNAWDPLTV